MILDLLHLSRFGAVHQNEPGATGERWTDVFGLALAGRPTAAGIPVGEATALTYSAVYNAVTILSSSVASLPLMVNERLPEGGKQPAVDHPAFPVLHDQANPEMTAFVFRETLMGHVLTFGNAYADIVLTAGGDVAELWPLRPDWVKPRRIRQGEDGIVIGPSGGAMQADVGRLVYEVRDQTGQTVLLDRDRVLHVPGLGFDGIMGYPVIQLAKESLAMGLAMERYGGAFFGNGASVGAVCEHPGQLKGDAAVNLRDSIERRYSGVLQAHRVMVLEEGMTWKQIGIPNEQAQFLESRRFQIAEVARWFNIPVSMLKEMADSSVRANIEQEKISFYADTLRPWLVRWEAEYNRKLLDDPRFFAEHKIEAILRADTQTRFNIYQIAVQNGIFSRNECRALENRNGYLGGDAFLVPMNMTLVGADGQPEDGSDTDADTAAFAQSYEGLFVAAFDRCLRKETKSAKAALKRCNGNGDKFREWLGTFYEDHAGLVQQELSTVVWGMALSKRGPCPARNGRKLPMRPASCADQFAFASTRRWIQSARSGLAAVADDAEEVLRVLNARLKSLAATTAHAESLQAAHVIDSNIKQIAGERTVVRRLLEVS